MITAMPMAIQRNLETYFEKSLSKQDLARHHFSSMSKCPLSEGVQSATGKDVCVLLRYRQGDRDLYGMCCSENIKNIIVKTIDDLDIVTFFFSDGALAISADKNIDSSKIDLHLVSWGSSIIVVDDISEKLGGQRY